MKKILYIGNNLSEKTNYNSTLDTLSKLLMLEGFEVKISSNKQNKFLRLLDMCFTLFKNRNQIDVVLIDTFSTKNFYYAFIISQLSRLFKLPYIPILHGGNLPNRLVKSPKMSNQLFQNSIINVSPSKYLKIAFEALHYKVQLIPNTLEITNYKFKKRKVFKPNLLWVRAFDKTYNPTMAIEVLVKLKGKYSDAKLCMVGPKKDETFSATLELVEQYGLKDSVEITGVMAMKEWHKKSEDYDIFINTTNFDNMPVSVIEAMALGLPVVSTNVGGLPYLIENNETGILVKPNNAQQMAGSIIDLIETSNNAILIAEKARLQVEKYDWSVVKENWLNILA